MKLPSYFISHGAGPWPFMKEEIGDSHDLLEASLRAVPTQLREPPKAIVVVSAHWVMPRFTLTASARPPLLYDYRGFPPRTYTVTYPAPGAPELAHRISAALDAAGLRADLDRARGLDHGAFVPLSVMFPLADIPVIQLSLQAGYDPAAHWTAGRALAALRDEGVMILGSGLSYHNTRPLPGSVSRDSLAFDGWLGQVLIGSTPADRARSLLEWESAPAARAAHPSEEHFIPLLVAAGAAEYEAAERLYTESTFLGAATISSFRFGA
jgi:aromatic ring-opening dioxygenase catalytic subunit (LigB family)